MMNLLFKLSLAALGISIYKEIKRRYINKTLKYEMTEGRLKDMVNFYKENPHLLKSEDKES